MTSWTKKEQEPTSLLRGERIAWCKGTNYRQPNIRDALRPIYPRLPSRVRTFATIRREPENPHGATACAVDIAGHHVGYLASSLSAVVAPTLDAAGTSSVNVRAVVRRIERGKVLIVGVLGDWPESLSNAPRFDEAIDQDEDESYDDDESDEATTRAQAAVQWTQQGQPAQIAQWHSPAHVAQPAFVARKAGRQGGRRAVILGVGGALLFGGCVVGTCRGCLSNDDKRQADTPAAVTPNASDTAASAVTPPPVFDVNDLPVAPRR